MIYFCVIIFKEFQFIDPFLNITILSQIFINIIL